MVLVFQKQGRGIASSSGSTGSRQVPGPSQQGLQRPQAQHQVGGRRGGPTVRLCRAPCQGRLLKIEGFHILASFLAQLESQ